MEFIGVFNFLTAIGVGSIVLSCDDKRQIQAQSNPVCLTDYTEGIGTGGVVTSGWAKEASNDERFIDECRMTKPE